MPLTPPFAKPEDAAAIGTADAASQADDSKDGKVTRLRTGMRRRGGSEGLRLARGGTTDDEDGDPKAGARSGLGRGNRSATPGGGRFAGKGGRMGRAGQRDDAEAEVAEDYDETEIVADLSADDRGTAQSAMAAPAYSQSGQAAPSGPMARYTAPDAAEDDDEAELPTRRQRNKRNASPQRGKADVSNYVVAPTVGPARLRTRHYGVILLFILMVIAPTATFAWYLWTHAADQFESDVGFASRTEQAPSPFDFLGALSGSGSNGAKDMDILNQFVISQEIVTRVDRKLDLRHIFSKPTDDPLMSFDPKGTIEDLVKFWQRMVLVSYDPSTGLMNLRIFAFDPKDSRDIAHAVLEESTAIINDLSTTAQEDATRYSKEALDAAESRLSKARTALTDFRVTNHFVDPSNELASQVSVVSTLTQQMAAAEIDLDMLTGTVADNDPRFAQLNRRIVVIANRIAEERAKVGVVPDSSAPGYAALVASYQTLQVDQDFAEKAYLSALASYDAAVLDAQHKTRYLATYLSPTSAEQTTAPNRPLQTALAALAAFLVWSVLVLVYYALRDRR